MTGLELIAAFNGAVAATEVIQKLIEHSKQTGEMTPVEEQAWEEAKAKAYAQLHWKPGRVPVANLPVVP